MVRFALSLILVSFASSLAFGCASSDSVNSEGEDNGQAAEQGGCIDPSTGHVIMCVPPPDPEPGCVYASTGHVIMCVTPPPEPTPSTSAVDCDALGAKLDAELADAQECIAGEDPPPNECTSWVPVRTGCEQPVFEAQSSATKRYLKLWDAFAAVCPVPRPPCPYPGGLATACETNTPTGRGICRIDDGTHPPTGD